VRFNRSSGLLLGALVLCALVPWAEADWPQARHDARRTAQATGVSDIQRPVAYWKRYLGGQLDRTAMLLADVDADGATEVLMITGGSAVAKRRTDAVVWRSPNLELVSFIGFADVDGRPGRELLARSRNRAYLLDPADGTVLWAEPDGEIAWIGGTRLGDVDGDSLPDLAVVDCVCCQVRGDNKGYVYSFARGAANPTRLWQFPGASCGGGVSLTLVRASSTEALDVLYGDEDALVLLDGKSGTELARTPDLGSWVQRSRCLPVDIIGGRSEELVCVDDADTDPLVNERKVFALRYRSGDPVLRVMWSRSLAPVESGALSWLDLVSDLDGNGELEVVVSALDSSAWTTSILDAATGSTIGSIPGEVVMGTAPSASGSVLLTSSQSHLSGWRLAGSALDLDWTVLDAVVLPSYDHERAARSDIATSATLAQVDGDGIPDIIATLRSAPGTIVGYSAADNDIAERARYQLPAGVQVQTMWPLASSTDRDLHLAVAHNDGFLTLFDQGLVPARDESEDDVSFARLRTGGYYARGWPRYDNTPRAARLGDDGERILLVDSRGSMLALDAQLGSFAAPPRLEWELPGGVSPSVVPRLDGDRPGVACLALDQPATTPPSYSVLALDRAGSQIWRQPAPPEPLNDLVAGNFDGDDAPDLVFQWGDPGDILLHTRALSGRDGATLWSSEPVEAGSGRKPAGAAVADLDGDGLDDVYHQVGRTQVLSGATGTVLRSSAEGPDYFLPTLVNLDGDAAPEVVLHGGPKNVRVLDDDLQALFVSEDANRPFPYAAVAECGEGGQVLIEGSAQYPSRLKLTDLSGGSQGQERTTVLAGGSVFTDEPSATGAAAVLGQLTSATVHADLTGGGHPTALVGSSDGWLYALDPCSGVLDFTYDFGAAVGEAIFADTDGDGRDEILVTVEDGYLYTLRNFEIDAPGSVRDTDPWSESEEDLSEILTVATLEASWTAVSGAVGYEVAVVDADGNYLGEPWRDAGTATRLVLEHLPLADGGTYRVSVRAVSASGGRSVDTVSDGVWVHLPDHFIDAPGGGGCCNSSTGWADAWSALLVLAMAALLRRRLI
jgi:hypothetical protein